MPAYVVDTTARARRRIVAAGLPCVLGHADFEAQNPRWRDGEVWAVHDGDSLAWQPEAALVGTASLWTAAHDVRWALHGRPPRPVDALRARAVERLLRADA